MVTHVYSKWTKFQQKNLSQSFQKQRQEEKRVEEKKQKT